MDMKSKIPQEYKTNSKLEKRLKFIFAVLPFPISMIPPFARQQGLYIIQDTLAFLYLLK